MPPHMTENIFNPFCTTQEYGSGLGLTIVHNIVQAHQGTIHVLSTDGQRLGLDPPSPFRIDVVEDPGSGNMCIDPWWRDPPDIRCSPDVMEK
jgi:signal transduction histidine kinase